MQSERSPNLFRKRHAQEAFGGGDFFFSRARAQDVGPRRHVGLKPRLDTGPNLPHRLLRSKLQPPNAKAKLPGPPARTLKLGKPGWRPRSASAVGSTLFVSLRPSTSTPPPLGSS